MTSPEDSVLDDILAAAESLTMAEPSSPASAGVDFPLILSGRPRRGGATPTGTVSFKSFSIVNLDCSDPSYCFGVIGNGGSFCIKKNCGIKSHGLVKMPFAGVDDSFVFICRNIPGSVFSEPKLSSSKIPEDVMEEWNSIKLDLSDWATEFQAVEGTNEPLTSADEVQIETEFLAESTLLRTPGKRKKDSFSGGEYEGALPV